jgi:tetratricopeptide (TPR) repeat protein
MTFRMLVPALCLALGLAAQEQPPSQREMLEKRADVQMARKDFREAVNLYQSALKLEPNNAVLHNKLGIGYQQQTKLDQAKKCYERAVKLNSKYSEAINNLGTIDYSRKKYRSAISRYEKALKIAPDSASIYSNLGTAHFARKKYEEAFAAYRKALQLDPEVFEHKSSYGVLLQERTVEDRARFHYFLAKTYAEVGRFEDAIDHLKKAFENGFKEKNKIAEDPSFVELIKTEAFAQLMANPPKALPQ